MRSRLFVELVKKLRIERFELGRVPEESVAVLGPELHLCSH